MSTDDPQLSREAINQRDLVVAAATTALTFPAALDPGKIAPVIEALRLGPDDDLCSRALSALGAIFYSRPDLAGPALLDRLTEFASSEALPHNLNAHVIRLFEFLASSVAAEQAWSRLHRVLLDQRRDPRIRNRLLQLVGDFVRWREEIVGLDAILELAESTNVPSERAFLLDYCVEHYVFCAPEAFDEQRLDRIATLFENAPRYRYVLRFLAARQSVAPGIRPILNHRLEGRFPLRDATAFLIERPAKLLVVMNIKLGQGDEIVRLAPLLQAFLDANPALAITLITQRTYLYESPRVKTISVKDKAAVEAAMAGSFEGMIEIFQPDRPEFAHDKSLHSAIEQLLVERRPALIIRAELGRSKKGDLGVPSEFLYEVMELSGREIAHSSGLDHRASKSNYEPCLRLIAEFGLPQRVAEEPPLTASMLAGVRSIEAERLWAELVGQDSAGSPRPTVLLNPFGGAGPNKGFFQQDQLLAAEIGGLVDEGYLVVMLPNGTPWGRQKNVLAVLSHLDAQTRSFVRVAPDPAETDRARLLEVPERPDLPYADRIMRLFKYFATYADLVITVEGWLAHLAYCLACPIRLYLANGSFTPDWFPYGRGPRQRLVAALSPRCRVSHSQFELLREGDAPTLPHGRRKQMLELALTALGEGDSLAVVRRALSSRDSDIRRYALAALARNAPSAAKTDFLAAMREHSPSVVRAGAEALLRANLDCSHELGPRYRELLQLELDVIDNNWDAVIAAGPAAFPALFRAGRCDSMVLATAAREVLRRVLTPYLHRSGSSAPNKAKR